MNRRTFLLLAAAVTLLAFGVREWYVLAAVTPYPFAGDSGEYLRYAINLTHGVFSHTTAPDDYRTPGYPLFLALFGHDLFAVRQGQVVVGTLTVAVTMALARLWMPPRAALASGLLLALWPHHIVASDAVLCEVLFGFLLVCALLCASLRRPVAAGVVFGYAYLVNPVVALLPACVAVVYWRQGMVKAGAVMLAVSLIAVAGWGIRSATLPPSDGRAAINIVQGSWPDFHSAYRGQAFPAQRERYAEINREIRYTYDHGWDRVIGRLQSDPDLYAKWYAVDKPLLLWGWDIQLGMGGPYFLITDHSPYDLPGWHEVETVYRTVNPLLTMCLLAFALILLRSRNPVALICGGSALYFTAIHVVFQAEPRYAIAYRPIEAVVVCGALAMLWQSGREWAKTRWSRMREGRGVETHLEGGGGRPRAGSGVQGAG